MKKNMNQGFKLPEGYFDSNPDRILSRIKNQEKTPDGKLRQFFNKSWRWGIAAAMALVLLGVLQWMPDNNSFSFNEDEITSLMERTAINVSEDALIEYLYSDTDFEFAEPEDMESIYMDYLSESEYNLNLIFETE